MRGNPRRADQALASQPEKGSWGRRMACGTPDQEDPAVQPGSAEIELGQPRGLRQGGPRPDRDAEPLLDHRLHPGIELSLIEDETDALYVGPPTPSSSCTG